MNEAMRLRASLVRRFDTNGHPISDPEALVQEIDDLIQTRIADFFEMFAERSEQFLAKLKAEPQPPPSDNPAAKGD